jgi:hypothetical protein
MEEHPDGLVVHATLEWVCEGCRALNIHDYPQDGRVRAIECQACRSPACLIVPSGRGMLPEKAAGMYVVCDDCGAQRDPTVRGCWKCDGLGHEPAGGRIVKPRVGKQGLATGHLERQAACPVASGCFQVPSGNAEGGAL